MAFVFDLTEFISFIVSALAMLYLLYEYFSKGKREEKESGFSVGLLLLIATFVFFNRLFTNAEAIAYKEVFNLLEHLSMLVAAFFAIALAWRGFKNGSR